MHIWQTFNALFIVRCTVKYLIETGSEYQLLQHFEAMPSNQSVATTAAAATTTNMTETSNGGGAGGAVAVNIDNDSETKSKLIRAVDGSKFETFFDAIVNLLIIIPVK